MYIAYVCLVCKIEFIIPSEHIERMKLTNKYLACNFGHRYIKRIGKYGDLNKCMQQKFSKLI